MHMPDDRVERPVRIEPPSRLHLVLVIASMGGGGAERVLAALANAWAARGWAVTLVTIGGEPSSYPLDGRIVCGRLNLETPSPSWRTALVQNFRRLRRLRAAIQKSAPDVVVSFLEKTNILTLLAVRGQGIPTIVSERTDMSRHRIGWVWQQLRMWTYPWASAVLMQTETARCRSRLRLRQPVRIIPNPVLPPAHVSPTPAAEHTPTVIAVGRLSPEKGFSDLIRAFGKAQRPGWRLVIYGDGPLRGELTTLIAEMRLQGRVSLPGAERGIVAAYAAADVFALSSHFEGFPNALCEAMAAGLAAVAYNCFSGPGEIIQNGCNGLLVPEGDIDALAAALGRLMDDASLRRDLGAHARNVCQRYSMERVLADWDAAFAAVLPRSRANVPSLQSV